MRIGIVTGGGDVPGLNPCIKTLVYRMIEEGHAPIGIRRGWRGLLQLNPADPTSHYENTFPLNKNVVRAIDRSGGTILHTSRVNPGMLPVSEAPDFLRGSGECDEDQVCDYTPHILDALAYLKLDALIVVGGDDTLSYAARIHDAGFPVLSIPKTMDNDVSGTEYCLGFSTAITRSVSAIQELRTTVASHERIGVIEVFGRFSGELALVAAYLSAANRAIIPEVPFDPLQLAELLMQDRRANPSQYAMMTVSEGARILGYEEPDQEPTFSDPMGNRKLGGIGFLTSSRLEELTRIPTVFVQLSFLVRAGAADTLDTMVAMNFANAVMDLIGQNQFGQMVAIQEGRYTHVSASAPASGPRHVDVDAFYDRQAYRPKVFTTLNKPLFLY